MVQTDSGIAELPNDCVGFLRSGRNLSVDPVLGPSGKIQVFGAHEVATKTVELASPTSHCDLDPYSDFAGVYLVEVVDLIKTSDACAPEGVLAWFPEYGQFGTYDKEHGNVLLFEDTTWADIVANAGFFLAQFEEWGAGQPNRFTEPLLWVNNPFMASESGTRHVHHEKMCPVHGAELHHRGLTARSYAPLDGIAARAFIRGCEGEYLVALRDEFPCAARPVAADREAYCPRCDDDERAWVLERHQKSPGLRTPAVNAQGLVTCPHCSVRFKPAFASVFRHKIHISCGTKLEIGEPSPV